MHMCMQRGQAQWILTRAHRDGRKDNGADDAAGLDAIVLGPVHVVAVMIVVARLLFQLWVPLGAAHLFVRRSLGTKAVVSKLVHQ